ncbi:hypothetical protein MRB53_019138 [Persea americana]|uniref:Uncharacterized protein n=1 Tax=Persea americana TaxID=3435 RepID=A0ACC2M9Q4_PERAE|nr:hypothetical protein MRB53_019138 [Persea americana]
MGCEVVIPSNGGIGNLMLTGIKGNIRSLGYSGALHDEKGLGNGRDVASTRHSCNRKGGAITALRIQLASESMPGSQSFAWQISNHQVTCLWVTSFTTTGIEGLWFGHLPELWSIGYC